MLQNTEGRRVAAELCPETLEPSSLSLHAHHAPGSQYSSALCPRPQDVHYSSLASAFELFLEALGEQELPLPQKLNSGQQDGRLLALAGTAAVSSTAAAGPRHGAGDRVHQASAETPMSIHCQVPRSKGRGQMWRAPHL